MTLRTEYLAAIAAHAGIAIDRDRIEPPRQGFATLNGLRMRYLEWGDPAARPLLLLHGGGQSAHTWDAFCLAMSGRFRCVALDQRGHGDSQWSDAGEYALADHARDVAALVDALALHRPIVVGMSMGGVNGIAYAASHPDRVGGLVCVDIGPEAQFEPVDRLMRGLGGYRVFDSPEDAAARLSRLGARRDPALLRDTLALNLRRQDDGTWTWKYDPRTLVGLTAKDIMDARRPLWGVLHRIACPVLVARGADSEIFTADDARKFAAALPDGRWMDVPRARHSVQTDNPAGLAEAVSRFADSIALH
ncbi:alpha/beta fold hydrolase [Ramlibacter sp. PS4R-6]|uniref:alpha/beta fold hydrolase n=1 Tax=Ramlibacter sp. PS4R-6 TaxID=3133438 RepID=UPI00309C0A83